MNPILLRLLALLLILSHVVVANVSLANSDEKVVLVTGASSGLGRQIALTLAESGFFVYAGARKPQDIQALSEIPNIQGVKLDVTIQADIDQVAEQIRERGRGLYGLVNNAGVFLFDPLIEISEQDLQFVMDVNVFGPYRVTKAMAPMIIQQQGRITTIGSIAGLSSGRLLGPYAMSKHAVEAFTESLASELEKFDVRVSVVEPGNFRSNIMKNMRRRIEELKQQRTSTRFEKEILNFASFAQEDRSAHKAPTPVAEAVLDFMTVDEPKRRYLVAPNAGEAHFTVRRALAKAIELNRGQPFEFTPQEMSELLNELLSDAG